MAQFPMIVLLTYVVMEKLDFILAAHLVVVAYFTTDITKYVAEEY